MEREEAAERDYEDLALEAQYRVVSAVERIAFWVSAWSWIMLAGIVLAIVGVLANVLSQ